MNLEKNLKEKSAVCSCHLGSDLPQQVGGLLLYMGQLGHVCDHILEINAELLKKHFLHSFWQEVITRALSKSCRSSVKSLRPVFTFVLEVSPKGMDNSFCWWSVCFIVNLASLKNTDLSPGHGLCCGCCFHSSPFGKFYLMVNTFLT